MSLFVALAGNIGVGKSSLTQILSHWLGWRPFFEAVDDNPYLADFYADMRRWSFHSQIFFLGRRIQDHLRILACPDPAVQDRAIYEDAEIFARNLYRCGDLPERDYRSYCTLIRRAHPVPPASGSDCVPPGLCPHPTGPHPLPGPGVRAGYACLLPGKPQ